MQTPRGRIAPSPSGRMHLGNLFSALLAWLSIRSKGGQAVLRMEDLDPQRTNAEYAAQLIQDLHWLGLDWDEGPDIGGPFAPYTQSERGAFYEECLEKLAAQGLTYPCFCTRAELHASGAPHASDGAYLYTGTCHSLTQKEIEEKSQKRPPAIRFRVPDETVTIIDGHYGPYTEYLPTAAGDQILRRSDGAWGYQLAAPADDGAMNITEVVRGRDLLSSAPRQAALMQALGYEPPTYFHIPMLLSPDGRRLSKRDRDLDVGLLRQNHSPEAVTGHLAALAGLIEKPEPLKPQDLIAGFDQAKVPKADITLHGL